jgi:RNA-directed DNA polymerase
VADLQVEINEEKSRIVDLGRGESLGFLGFDFRRIRSRRSVSRAHNTPKLKKRTALLRKLKDVFRRTTRCGAVPSLSSAAANRRSTM